MPKKAVRKGKARSGSLQSMPAAKKEASSLPLSNSAAVKYTVSGFAAGTVSRTLTAPLG